MPPAKRQSAAPRPAKKSRTAKPSARRAAKTPAAKTLAAQADKHRLYQLGVQSPHADAALLQKIYRQARGARALHFREDFCAGAATLCAWLQQGGAFSGEGYDIDAEVIDWGRRHNFAPLGAAAGRARLCVDDARAPSLRAPDIRCAFNFSCWIFRERREMLDYFRGAREDLAEGGVFVIDMHGGGEVFSEEEHVTDCGGFDLVFQQTGVRPADHHANLALHFRFPDGSELRNAFRYHWRIWSMPELTDILREAGFADIRIHWCMDEDQCRYEITGSGHNDPAWLACLAALK